MKNLYQLIFLLLSLFSVAGTYAQVPVYNSYPSAPATIYLDFDGHYLEGTSWNWTGAIACGPSNLSSGQITEIYNRIAEDYRPFDINVTTDSTIYAAALAAQRIRIIFTISSDWYGRAGGVSFVGSFTWGDNTPAFVFTALLNYNTKYIAEAGAHEAGHTLGLRHQSSYDNNCVKTAEYNPGAGSGEIGWAPIMGVSYYKNFTLWNNGANPYGCTVYQDDLNIITTMNGFGYRPDDYSNDFADPAFLGFSNNSFNLSGMIEQSTDIDIFKFDLPSFGSFHLNAIPFNVGTGDAGADLDMQIDLMKDANTVIASYDPGNLLNSTIDTVLNEGSYYLRVQSKGNAYATQYASLGAYTLQGVFIKHPLPLHKLELQGNSENSSHKLNWIIEADENLANQSLEVSANKREFHSIVQPLNTARQFAYVPGNEDILYYRLNVLFDNGKQYYSNTIALRNIAALKPLVMGNLVKNSITITSPSKFEYTINDYNGRFMSKGKLTEGLNTISSYNLSTGIYIIQFNNGSIVFTNKLIKQ